MIRLPDLSVNLCRNLGVKVSSLPIVTDHIRDFDGRILDRNPKLFKPAFAFADIDLVVIIFEIHLTLT